jgi:phosphomannomutase
MKLLKIGISGVRGIVGESITPRLVMDFAGAFGTFVNAKPVLVARDTRISGPMLHAACTSALLSSGCSVLDLGVCPTPILQLLVKPLRAMGGISITAGHNDIRWNALTFVSRDGTYLNSFQGAEVLDIYHLGKFKKVTTDRLGRIKDVERAADTYFEKLADFINSASVAQAGLKVVIDACNGAGAPYLGRLAETLGFALIPINHEPNGFFPHDPEPRPRNAQQVVSIIKAVGADVGFLLNSDVSRVSIVTETGESLSEEFTFPLVANDLLKDHCGPVITNLSTSRMIEDVTRSRNCPLIRTKVGQSYAIQSLLQENGVMAGEGSGGVALAKFQPAFDGFLTMGAILEAMARRAKKISELVDELPRYHIVKEKIYCAPTKIHSVVNEVKRFFHKYDLDTSDGIRVEDKHGWVQIRASVTEPMIRIIAEDQAKDRARQRADEVIHFINRIIK